MWSKSLPLGSNVARRLAAGAAPIVALQSRSWACSRDEDAAVHKVSSSSFTSSVTQPACGSRPPARCEERVAKQESRVRRACCIGAGAAGLTCAKELLERGFEVVVIEAREGIGGVWRFDGSGNSVGVRTGQRATSSKFYLGFSDFPIPDSAPDFVSHEEYLQYLEEYAKQFGVKEHIRFRTRVSGLRRGPNGNGWQVEWNSSGKYESEVFDAVAVCAGLHGTPDFPPRGAPQPPSGFTSSIKHARSLKDAAAALAGKRVVVVGGGETGAELAHVAAVVGASPSILALRRGITVIGPYLPFPLAGRFPDARTPPVDLNERRALSLLPHHLKHFVFTQDTSSIFALRDDNPGQHTLGRLLDRMWWTTIDLLAAPTSIVVNGLFSIAQEVTHPLFWQTDKPCFQEPNGTELSRKMAVTTGRPPSPTVRLDRDLEQLQEYMDRATRFRLRGFTNKHYQEIRSLLEEYSGARHTQNFLTKSDDFIYDLMDGSLEVRPGIAAYESPDVVVFEDGSKAQADIIVWCTGYKSEVPFLKEILADVQGSADSSGDQAARLDGQSLFKHVFHPELGDTFAFIGFARPQLGAMPPIAELQARWFGAVLDGDSKLPSRAAMHQEAAADAKAYNEKIFSSRLRSSVDFALYTSEIAQYAGCYPRLGLQELLTDFPLWQAFWMGPVVPQAYRLADVGERGLQARQRMLAIYRTFFTRE